MPKQPSISPDIVNLVREYSALGKSGPMWGCDTGDLNGTYLVLAEGEQTPLHVNDAVDVIMVVLSGSSVLTVNGVQHEMNPGSVAVLRRGDERGLLATGSPFSYVNIHRRRVLMPGNLPPKRSAL